MRLLKCNDGREFSLTKDFGGDVPGYAILSHTWGANTEEVSFKDLIDGVGKTNAGYDKIRFCGAQARRDSLQYFWVDTCCIDTSNSAELAEAINSMFRWYRNAAKCYVYLSDVLRPAFDTEDKSHQLPWESAFLESRWFTRGWTLQELIAPTSVEFFSRDGERMSWAGKRETTRQEDKAYSLLGIFDVHMPLIYGQGREKALKRLREEITKALKGMVFSHITSSFESENASKC